MSASESLAAIKAAREGCGGVCKNGGHCTNGECKCRDGFEGQFCQDKEEGVSGELVWFFIISLILVIAAIIFWKAKDLKKMVLENAGQGHGQAQDSNAVGHNPGSVDVHYT